MKKTIFSFLLLAFFTTASSQVKRYQATVIGFYNLENLYDTVDNPLVNDDEFTPTGAKKYDTKIFKDKLNKLATVIHEIGTAYNESGLSILGVAEIENDTVLQYLIQHPLLLKRNYHIVHASSNDLRGVDVGLLFDPMYFIPIHVEKLFVPLPGNSKDASFTRDILYTKGLLFTDTVHIYVNHWPSRRGGQDRSEPARLAAATVCRKQIDSIQHINPTAKIIVMGDLNDDPHDKSLTDVMKASSDRSVLQPNQLYNPWGNWLKKGIGTLAHRDSWGLFDQILISTSWLHPKPGDWFLFREHIFNKAYLTEYAGRYKGYPMRTWDGNRYRGGYSDHFPVYMVFLREAIDFQ